MIKKFIDPNIKNKSKTVENRIQFVNYKNKQFPLPTRLRLASQVFVIENVPFAQEVLQTL